MHDLTWTLPFFLYAETHYRFKYFFSLLKKNEPEVIADTPHRIEPHSNIPLLILAKDADKFPTTLTSVKVVMRQGGSILREVQLITEAVSLHERLWWKVYNLSREGLSGWLELDVLLTLTTNGKSSSYWSDNHRTSSHKPLRIYLSDDPLPSLEGLYLGDTHTHSDRTDDQVEFGIPITPAIALSKGLGLSFFCVADHSYDLDDAVDNWARNDPHLPKWKSLLQDTQGENSKNSDFVVIPGEEISCRNSVERNVHFLLLGDKHFFEGSGDGAERWFYTRCENSIADILNQKDQNALAFAAHPMEPVSILQRLLLGRGSWSFKDLSDPKITGIQFANGMQGLGFDQGYRAWIRSLLEGRRVYCLAGNDAHGNFNRFRQIGIPFLRIRESNDQLFGKMRTGVYIEGRINEESVLKSFGEGRSLITDGPVINVLIKENKIPCTSLGEEHIGPKCDLEIFSKSTKEFGAITELNVFLGVIGDEAEQLYYSERLSGIFEHHRSFSVEIRKPMYLRAEVYTSDQNDSDKCQHFCFTNPVWFTLASES